MSEPGGRSSASERLRADFELLRKNSAARAPRTLDAFFEFLRVANAFGPPARRRRPIESGLWRI